MLRNCWRIKENLAIGFIECKKIYDMVPQSWLQEAKNLVGVAENDKSSIVY